MIDTTAMDDAYFKHQEQKEAVMDAKYESIINHAYALIEAGDSKTIISDTSYSLTDIADMEANNFHEIIEALCNGKGQTLMKKYVENFAFREASE
jgi:hypothetical protein